MLQFLCPWRREHAQLTHGRAANAACAANAINIQRVEIFYGAQYKQPQQ
jgi:hypothetical protein